MLLTDEQQKRYWEQGYLVIPGAIAEAEITRLERGCANNPPIDDTLTPNSPVYPAPGRYTLANQCLKDPDLAFIVDHEAIVPPVRQLLNDQPKLTAYVIYDRTPGGGGIPSHHDYKRWRPVGSSVNWLFTIVPFCDFNEQTGRLFVAPGSHHLERLQPGAVCTEVTAAIRPEESVFIDPQLKRGDLLLMNMHTWHRAEGNRSDQSRVGLFNKYAAASAPPATGYYLYDQEVYNALTESGKELIACHTDRKLALTRALLLRHNNGEVEVLLQKQQQKWCLPGGATWDERAIPDWDLGNMIEPLRQHLKDQLNIEVPWLSYIGDFMEEQNLCRVYGYQLNTNGFPVAYADSWVPISDIDKSQLADDWILTALHQWLDKSIVRGKGLSQAQCRIDQFAY